MQPFFVIERLYESNLFFLFGRGFQLSSLKQSYMNIINTSSNKSFILNIQCIWIFNFVRLRSMWSVAKKNYWHTAQINMPSWRFSQLLIIITFSIVKLNCVKANIRWSKKRAFQMTLFIKIRKLRQLLNICKTKDWINLNKSLLGVFHDFWPKP